MRAGQLSSFAAPVKGPAVRKKLNSGAVVCCADAIPGMREEIVLGAVIELITRTQLATDDKTAELQLDALRVTLDQLGLALGYAATTSARADNGREWQRIIRSKVGAILGADPALLRPIVKDTLHFTLNNHNDDAWGVPVDKLGYVGRTRDFAAISRPQIILGYKGPSPGQFIAPGPVAGTLDGRWLIVFDNDGSRIQLFDIATRPADKQQQQPSALLIRVIRNVSVTNAYAVAPSSSCVAQTATAAGTDATSPLAHVVPALWVAEYNTNRVVGLSLAGQRLPGRLISCKRPVGVAVALADLSLDVLVASEEGSVIRVSSDGSTVRWTFNPRTARQIREEYLGLATNERNDLLAQPSAVALSQPDQKHVVVADKAWGRLITVDAATGKFGRYICAERTLSGPTSIACLEPNLVVVAESTAHRVSMWTLDGEHVCSWGSPNGAAPPRPDKYFGGGAAGAPPGPRQANTAALNRSANVANNPLGPGEFSRPSHVAVLADGRIAVMDSIECRVQIF